MVVVFATKADMEFYTTGARTEEKVQELVDTIKSASGADIEIRLDFVKEAPTGEIKAPADLRKLFDDKGISGIIIEEE